MFKALQKKRQRYEEIKKLLSDPKIVSDIASYQKLAKEKAALEEIVTKYKDFLSVSQQIQNTEGLLKERHEKEFEDLARQELKQLTEKKRTTEKELQDMLLEDDPDANKSIIVEIRAGTGGLEATLFAADLFRMYSKFAAKSNWKIEVLSTSPSEAGGFKEMIFAVEGYGVYKKFKYESGVHRVQRVPTTEASGRIHTSAATVAVLPEAEELDLQINPKDVKIDVFRATGPGGQGVNTTDSAVRITYIPTRMVVTCQDERSQLKNKMKAMKVLRARLLDDLKRKQQDQISRQRKLQIGTGDRSEKIRTYNFPDRRVTDHRISLTLHKLEEIMEGELDEIISALIAQDRKLKLLQDLR